MPISHLLGREQHVKAAEAVPYRLLEADEEFSAGDAKTPNMLIQGDNLEALEALLPYYAGRVKCIFIGPPYNTRSAFEHYGDNVEHTQWLAMMFPRLQMLRSLLELRAKTARRLARRTTPSCFMRAFQQINGKIIGICSCQPARELSCERNARKKPLLRLSLAVRSTNGSS